MISMPFEYARATSLDDAIAKMKASGGGGKFIAGGHSLVPLMKLRLSEPQLLIDIGRIPGLSGIREQGGQIEIGAGTVHHDVASSALLQEKCPMVPEAASDIGDRQVRNRGTIGGSLAHADPSADYPALMLALDANINVQGAGGARTIKADAFFQDLFTVDLSSDEVIVSVRFAPVRTAAYAKFHQRASHYAIVGVAAVLQMKAGVIESARIGLTGAGPKAVRLREVEAALAGQRPTNEAIATAAAGAGSALDAINSDIHASEDYRRAMIPVFTARAIAAAAARS